MANSKGTSRCYVSTEGSTHGKKFKPELHLIKSLDLSFIIKKFTKLSTINLENKEEVR